MSFKFAKAFEPFIEKCPIAVMARGVRENLLNSERIDGLLEQTAETQYTQVAATGSPEGITPPRRRRADTQKTVKFLAWPVRFP